MKNQFASGHLLYSVIAVSRSPEQSEEAAKQSVAQLGNGAACPAYAGHVNDYYKFCYLSALTFLVRREILREAFFL